MNIGYITNAPQHSGVGHRAVELRKLLAQQSDNKITDFAFPNNLPFAAWPGILGSKSVNWIRWGKRIKPKRQDVFDITNQTLAFLAKDLAPSVVTIHDIIEVTEPQTKAAALLNKYLYSGIPKASHIVTVSAYTKKAVMEYYNISKNKITVIPNGVGAEFQPIKNITDTIGYQELRREYKLGDSHPIVLYVGSDHPRKNLPVALEVFAQVLKRRPDAIFLKVGSPGILSGRETTLETIEKLNLREHVRFINDVTDEQLNTMYNLADVLLFPSRFEGFGLPPLQAMATGLPVVTSNATSIPEIVRDAALTSNPDDVEALTKNALRITEDRVTAAEYRTRGIARARKFSWEKSAKELLEVYSKVTR